MQRYDKLWKNIQRLDKSMQKYETECMFYWVRVPKVQNITQKYTKIRL